MKNRKLIGALLGASALALAGCAGGTPSSDDGAGADGAELRVWLVGTDTPQEARDYLVDTFEAENEGAALVIEEQQWTGLVDLLTTAMSGSESPDVVEVGNTQAAAFTSAGAFSDLSDLYETLGGDDLLPGFVEAGSYDGAFYAAPYYSGSRVVFYNTGMYAEAGVEVPKTLDEYVANATALAEATGVSGVWYPGKDWYNALPFIWENGGEVAVLDGDEWDAQLSSPESIAGLEQVATLMASSQAPKDGDETEAWVPFREEQAATLSAPSWAYWSIVADEDQAETALSESLGSFALPGADGGAAQVFAGGSNIAIPAASQNQELARSAVEIMLSEEYQSILAGAGLVPALQSLGGEVAAATPELAAVVAEAAANAKLTPASPKWADVEAAQLLQDFFVQIASGGDIPSLAAELDADIEAILNG
ncbi:extracellular solute-binding protein [Microbacterium gilvum]|uniref:Sugar ABC transporter substrate-binding protein n=1 Tax=Microbacterium gilvum TaxID=1336204 RepID=A0ABP9ARS0_9MICO